MTQTEDQPSNVGTQASSESGKTDPLVVNIASAELVQGIEIDFVTVGNASNPG